MDDGTIFNGCSIEDNYDNHTSVINKSAFLQYMVSTRSATNISSLILLDDIWKSNKQLISEKNNVIVKYVKSLSEVNCTDAGSKKWSLSDLEDPIALFEQSLSNCTRCSQTQCFTQLNQFVINKCSCPLNVIEVENTSSSQKENLTLHKRPWKSFNSEVDDKTKWGEEHKQTFRPKFGKVKLAKHSHQISLAKTPIYPDVDLDKEEEMKKHKSNVAKLTFKTAKEQLLASNPAAKRTLGTSRKAQSKFVSPMIGAQEKQELTEPEITDESLKHIDPKMIELIESEIIDKGTPIGWDDIAGLQLAKSVIQEAVVWPLLRPDIFTGLRRPPKGILLFGPPGTGKTLIGKCVAAQCKATFFSISASSLTSKWIGDGEKMVRALFAVARRHQPAVIFIDEIDSLLTQRSDTEHEATRRIKTEFLVQFDGAATGEEDRLLIVGATNRPQELDEAARRRLVKRLYIPLPDVEAREQIITNLLTNATNDLTPGQVREVASLTDGYSGADMKSLCSEAAMGPVRSVPLSQIISIDRDKVRPVNVQDFKNALKRVRPSVSQDDLGQYVKWNTTYGQGF